MKLKFSQQIFDFDFHADRQADEWTDMTMLKAAFCNSANVPKGQKGHICINKSTSRSVKISTHHNNLWICTALV